MKIDALLVEGAIQVKNIGLWGEHLPPTQIQKFFIHDIFSSIHTFGVNFMKIGALLVVGAIKAKNIGLW